MKLNCNNCNAPLDLDLDNLQTYCPYCGRKLLLDFDQVEQIIAEKEKTKRAINRETEQTKRKKMAYEYDSREKEKEWKRTIVSIVAIILAISLVFFYILQKHDEKVAYLQELEIEIDADIKSENYDAALLKANKLYCDDNWSGEETETWDVKRKTYIKMIEDKKREQDLKNPNNIFMPASSDSLVGKKYKDVVDKLKALGFTNISTQVASESAGLFKKSDTIEHILINGVTEFTTEDYFNKDTPIIVYYYSK